LSNYIHIDEIEDGQILAEPLTNRFGQVILPSGATLTKSYVQKLKTWNIYNVCVKGDPRDETTIISEEIMNQAEILFRKKCDWEPENSIEKEIINIGINELAKQLATNNGNQY
jgi:hypothetical protein